MVRRISSPYYTILKNTNYKNPRTNIFKKSKVKIKKLPQIIFPVSPPLIILFFCHSFLFFLTIYANKKNKKE